MFVRIDMKSEWPTVSFTRNPADDGAEYFGPYFNGYAIKKALRFLRRIFPYYTKAPKMGERVGLDTQIGLSPRPGISSKDYKTTLKQLIRYVQGGRLAIMKDIEKAMHQAAVKQDFEAAAQLRNKLLDLKSLQQKIMFGDREFLDISKDRALSDLTNLLNLPKTPARIEGYDISHMSGTNVVASMVVFTNGVSDRSNYRKFKTRLEQNDDYANLYEVLSRRLSEKNLKSWGTPDLLLIDGGKGQLDAVLKALEEKNLKIPTISIAKRDEEIIIHGERSHISMQRIEELLSNPEPGVVITRSGHYYSVNLHAGQTNAGSHSRNLRGAPVHTRYSDVVKLFQRIRDESHRFAVSYHTVLKRAKQTAGTLEEIPGVGPATRRKLIKTFGSLRGVKEASDDALNEAIGAAKAAVIRQFLK